MCGMSQGDINLSVFQETEVTGEGFAREFSGYCVTAMVMRRPCSGGGAVFYCKAEHLSLDALCLQGPDVVIFQLGAGWHWWHVVGC